MIWKLLRQHISIAQFIGFFFANLFGMYIILLGIQFYRDVEPVFTAKDSFMSSDYLIVSKKIGTATGISGQSHDFSENEINAMKSQPFVSEVGCFTSAEFKVEATMGINGQNILSSELPIESVPDQFIDVSLDQWNYQDNSHEVPILLPRSYINMYNFGFARSHSLPKISDGLVGMIDFHLFIHGNNKRDEFKGKVIGFSSRLNSILVPQAFMDWANQYYAPNNQSDASRLMIEVKNPTDERISQFMDENSYEVEDDKLQAEKTTYFLKLIVSIVMVIGLVISVLSFYILMLSIYLLVQKNSEKLENLLLIGYSPSRVARPYQILTIALNLVVLIIAWIALFFTREYYMDIIETFFPQLEDTTMMPAILVGLILFVIVTLLNIWVISRKISRLKVRK